MLDLEQEGCFVFQVVGSSIRARSKPTIASEDRTRLEFQPGELVSTDLLQGSNDNSLNAPPSFCRLTDRTGWLFTKLHSQLRLEALDTDTGLWAFYIDTTAGQFLRRHPVDSQDLSYNTHYKYMQKVFCDRKVSHPTSGVTYYRVQGTQGWLADRLPEGKKLLISCDHVEMGNFAFRALSDVTILSFPSASLECMTRKSVPLGETVICDIVREDGEGGPFMRLADGTGWVCEQKSGIRMMEAIVMRKGSWEFRVKNPPVGVGLRTRPSDTQNNLTGKIYPPGCIVHCDRAISNSQGVVFYRVAETTGWIFDRRADTLVLELLASSESKPSRDAQESWQPDFVRGIIATVPSATELSYDATTGTMVVETLNAQVHVYCHTRMIGVLAPGESRQQCQRHCNVTHLMARLKDEPINQEVREEEKREELDLREEEVLVKEQEELQARKDLLQCEFEIGEMKAHRLNLLIAIQGYEESRNTDTSKVEAVKGRGSAPSSADETCKSSAIHNHQNALIRQPEAHFEKPRRAASSSQEPGTLSDATQTTDMGRSGSSRQSPSTLGGSSICDGSRAQEKTAVQHVPMSGAIETEYATDTDHRSTPTNAYGSASESSLTETDQSNLGSSHRRPRLQPMKPVQEMHPHFFTSPMYTIPVSTTSNIATASPSLANPGRRKPGGSRLSQRRAGRGMFSCGECNDRFESIESRDLHCATVHKTQCSHCRRVFKSFAALNQHEQSEHVF